jgi:Zn-dependent protease
VPPLPPGYELLAIGITIFLAIGIHEFCHAKFADMAGDPTPAYFGRVTLNLTKHFELMGTIMIVITSLAGVGIGWGKPVPMDPSKMRNPKWDHFVAVAAGPASNFIQAAVFALFVRLALMSWPEFGEAFGMVMSRKSGVVEAFGFGTAFVAAWFFYAVIINVALCLFNLIPIGPLDGMWLLGTFMDDRTRLRWTRFNLTVGGMIFIGIIIFGQLSRINIIGRIIEPPLVSIVRFLIGF